ncbi:MAG: ChpI protein [Spirochaetota bacterium]
MKTAVSLPDALYKDAEITARNLGIPRSQLFARVLEEFIRHHQREGITEKLDAIYSAMESDKAPSQSPASLEAMREFTKTDSW